MRGKEYYTEFILTKNRITPAYAGKSLSQAEIPEWG